MLDANACIYLLTDLHSRLAEKVANQDAGSLCISSVAFAEVAMGSVNGKPPDMTVLDAFVAEVPVVAFDEAAARVYATLAFKRGNFDRLIAAHALALGVAIVTCNEKHFADAPGLRVADWTV